MRLVAIASKGKKQVQKLSSAERGVTITVVTCMSAGKSFARSAQEIPSLSVSFQKEEFHNVLPKPTVVRPKDTREIPIITATSSTR